VTYLAYFVGDLAQGASFDVAISYVVAQALKVIPNTDPVLCEFPQYRVNFLELELTPTPRPSRSVRAPCSGRRADRD
jgi:hypothetical protein